MDSSCEPMDIDLSSNSAMEVSYTDNLRVTSPVQELWKSFPDAPCNESEDMERLKIVEADRECLFTDTYRNKWSSHYVILTSLLILLLSFLFINSFYLKCHEELNVTSLKETLRSNIFGQNAAIENLIKALEVKDNSKLVILYGGTGVGKTLTASLLLNNIVNYTNIYHYTMPVIAQTFSSEFMIGFILCKSSIIIIDDIRINDTEVKSIVEEIFVKSRNLLKKLTIILIYSCDKNSKLEKRCDNHFASKLEFTFNDIPVFRSLVKFEPLSEDTLIKCIKNEIGRKKFNEKEILRLIKIFNVQLDGCKGVHQKMKYFNYV